MTPGWGWEPKAWEDRRCPEFGAYWEESGRGLGLLEMAHIMVASWGPEWRFQLQKQNHPETFKT